MDIIQLSSIVSDPHCEAVSKIIHFSSSFKEQVTINFICFIFVLEKIASNIIRPYQQERR